MVSRDNRPTFIKFGEHVSSALGRPLNTPDFIALRQTLCEKSITDFYTLHYFGATGGGLLGQSYQCSDV